MDATFKTVTITNEPAPKEKSQGRPSVTYQPEKGPIKEITPPLEIYESVKGRPSVVDVIGVKDLWDLQKTNNNVEGIFNIKEKVGAIENWVRNEIQRQYLPMETKSTERILRLVDKMVSYTSKSNGFEKIDALYTFVKSTNKARSFQRLREALKKRAIDEVVDLDYIKPSDLSKFMPRKD